MKGKEDKKKRVRRGRKKLAKGLKRKIRITSNLNEAEIAVAERKREDYGYKEMGAYIRASILEALTPKHFENPQINTETADAMISSFSCFNQALHIIHTNSGIVNTKTLADLLSKYFAYGDHIAKCRQELYGKFDKQTVAHYATSLLNSTELKELADKASTIEKLEEELQVRSLEAEYDR